MNALSEVLEALTYSRRDEFLDMGKQIGRIYTDFGFPIDMALEKLPESTKQQKLLIIMGAQNWLIEHRKNSSATDKALERQRRINKEALERFIQTGETGMY